MALKWASAVLLSGLWVTGAVQAEGGCPAGMIPYQGNNLSSCAPLPGGYNQQSSQPAGPQWATRWGAIATDPEASALGVAVSLPSKRKATKAAMADCKAKGGVNCTVDFSYYNQCASMVMGANRFRVNSAATVEEATEASLRSCRSSDSDCRVYYTACSMPQRIR